MWRYLASRLLQGLLVIFSLQTITFVMIRALPGHPFSGERQLPEYVLLQLRRSYGMDQSLWQQYLHYWKGLLSGDLGPSLVREGFSVSEIIAKAFPVSLSLGVLAMALAVLIALPLGSLAALYRNRWPDWLCMLVALGGICTPGFIIAPLLIGMVLAFDVGLPIAGWDNFSSMWLPAITLALAPAASLARLIRSGLLDVLGRDFIRTARAKGAGVLRTLFVHALRGGVLPAVSYLGPALAATLTGSFVVESIFLVPGLGQHFVSATSERDYFLLQGLVLLYGALIVLANLLVDLLQAWLNPQLRSKQA